MKLHGILGIFIIITAEILLFGKNEWIGVFFTPMVWTGYILFVDSLVFKLRGSSFICGNLKKFLLLTFLSIPFWYIFEFYNLFLHNWRYIGLQENKIIRYFGYFWSFATIWPAIFQTRDLILAAGFTLKAGSKNRTFSKKSVLSVGAIGLLFLIIPLTFPSPYLSVLVWTGLVLFLDPLNYWWNGKSLLKDLEQNNFTSLVSFMLSGLICGILWEFWNFWATARWVYNVPIWENLKIFEMPVVGYLGFLSFGLETYVMFNTAEIILAKLRKVKNVSYQME